MAPGLGAARWGNGMKEADRLRRETTRATRYRTEKADAPGMGGTVSIEPSPPLAAGLRPTGWDRGLD